MKMLYISCHSILEYDEIRLFDSLGIEIFSLGSYLNPNHNTHDKCRPSIVLKNWNEINYENFLKINNTGKDSRLNIPKWFVDNFDVVYVMGWDKPIIDNWDNIKHKTIIWRTIGQSSSHFELHISKYVKNGNIKIVRYSPCERILENYNGEDALIRFSKKPEEWGPWEGTINSPVTVVQTMKQRSFWTSFDFFTEVSKYTYCKLYGKSNSEISNWNGRSISLEELINVYKKHRVYYYFGTKPASYTLNFIEALMSGMPIVALGIKSGSLNETPDLYEIPKIINNGENGFLSDDPLEFSNYGKLLLENYDIAKKMSINSRNTAINLFSEDSVIPKWKSFFNTL